jgi:uncharacterized protein
MLNLERARAWYTDDDPVHDFAHIQRVYHLAERLAQEEGADLEIVHAAALLHDAQGSESGKESRKDHHERSAEFAAEVLRGEGWEEERIRAVQHCIRAHRYRDDREPPATIEAQVLFDADKLDVIGAVGVARTIAYSALAGQPFYADPSPKYLQTWKEEPGEPHTAYHEYLFKLVNVKNRMFTRSGKAMAEARHAYLVEYFAVLQAEVRGER